MKYEHIAVSKKNHLRIMRLKRRWGLKTCNEVITKLEKAWRVEREL